ncbi:MAG: diaminopimelate epimerase [Bacteroidales bacterium]|jgi:diaminopimelate epimerase|nr:diaminopimelate epimerase [Bacteroidales bacterium]
MRFEKYQAAGNDFIIINGFEKKIILAESQIVNLCNRHFGVGADGLIIIERTEKADFYMDFYNSDGSKASMCGNGARCAVKSFYHNFYSDKEMKFLTDDGLHYAKILDEEVVISMADVVEIKKYKDGCFLNTGVPHFVTIVEKISEINVNIEGRKYADDIRFAPSRTNVDFVEIRDGIFNISTYERGVEAETLSCGTGVVATAIAMSFLDKNENNNIQIKAKRGSFKVSFNRFENTFSNIKLFGEAKFVFFGEIIIL